RRQRQMWIRDSCRQGLISEAEALTNSSSPEDLQLMLRGIRRGASADEFDLPGLPVPSAGKPGGGKGIGGKEGLGGTKESSGTSQKKKMDRGFNF
ncbi:MAG: hypothetical protein N3A38_02685, partial [Planctomycetota bacterium]|nr:hypothetical protein [Planctomycetota bacterium]